MTFLPTSEGGRTTPAMSGVRPQLKVGNRFTSCIVRSAREEQVFQLGREYDVELDLIFPEEYQDSIDLRSAIELFDGSRLIAVGQWVVRDEPGGPPSTEHG
ncbi:hypothetical protein DMB66_41680 [Actinoplanes sp. ATCC 53533]|uniref:hypothetical protein n=1 Tax=Actinoplanes sp. ATCC 53533 TaxID=1288362 RepID=UPI000F7A6CE4|nr:hypothetical protein [Actinoplanes sp. ATCC 53533]RSM51478.1 hypothetical protein DMB66_41680 [Actinoplanes sp. ATCC 53533]